LALEFGRRLLAGQMIPIFRHATRLTKLGLAVFLALQFTGAARAQTRRVIPSPSHCKPPSASQEKWLSSEWIPYLKYSRACSIRDAKHRSVIVLISVWAELYYKAQAAKNVEQVDLPHPQIFSPSGEILGSLPYNFPDDPPAELRVTFTRWVDDFPERIELFLNDPRAAGNRQLPPMIWSRDQKKYVPEKREGT